VKTIAVKVGDRIEYLGAESWREDLSTGKRTSEHKTGDVGTVVEVKRPEPAAGIIVDRDGEEIDDQGRDGCAVVLWPNWGRGLIWPDGEGRTWKKVSPG
jgi:hypothetical protein